MEYRLDDLIDIPLLQDLQDKLNSIYSFPSAIIDNEGKILTAVAWQDVCTKFHRKHPQCERECIKSDQYIQEHLHEANPAVSYKCPHGLVDNAAPIVIDGKHLGNFFTGQFFLEKPDLEFFRKQAKKYSFNEKAYLEAVEKVPIWTEAKVSQYLDFIKGFIEIIAGIGLKQLKEIENRETIKVNEERHRTILHAAIDGFWITDIHGYLLEVNDSYCKMSGYSSKELLKMNISDLEDEEYVTETKAHMQKIIHMGQDRFESRHRRKDGSSFNVEVNVQYREADGGQCVVFISDITERKHAEEKIKRNEAQLANAIDIAKLGPWEYDLASDTFTFNDPFYALYRTTVEREGGYTMTSAQYAQRFVHADDMILVGIETQKAIEATDPNFNRNIEHRCIYADGEMGYINVNFYIIKDEKGRTIKTYGVNQDITWRKRTEEAIKVNEQKFREIYNSTNEAILINDTLSGQMIDCNQRAIEMYGYSDKEEITRGNIVALGSNVEPYTDEKVQHNIRKAIEGGNHTFEWLAKKKNGDFFSVEVNLKIAEIGGEKRILSVVRDITERKKIEQKLKSSESRALAIINSSPVPMAINNEQLQITYLNPAFTQLYGYEIADIPTLKDWWPKAYPDSDYRQKVNDDWAAEMERVKKTGDLFKPMELTIRCKNGTDRTAFISATSFNSSQENEHLVIFQDITEYKQAEEKMRNKDKEFRKLSLNLPDLIFQFTRKPDGTYFVPIASEGIRNIFGCSPEDVLDDFTPIGKVIHPDDATRVISDIEYSAEHLTYFTCEFRVQIPGKEIQWIYSRSTPEKLPDGSVTWYGFNADITDRKLAEEKLKTEQAFRESIELSLSSGIAIVDNEGRQTYVNPSFCELFGWSKEELEGMLAPHVYWPADQLQFINETFQLAISGKAPKEGFELEFICKDGSLKPVHIIISPFNDGKNRMVGKCY
ncbi:MAG: PAS domain S-box protein [Bacteroidales bacterium]